MNDDKLGENEDDDDDDERPYRPLYIYIFKRAKGARIGPTRN